MPTPSDRETERVVVEDGQTVDTAVSPPVVPAPPPVAPPPDPAGYPVTEQVLVDDPGGTRVVTRDVPPPLPPDEDPRRWNWLTPALAFILLAALGIVLAAILLSRNNDNKKSNAPATTNVVTTTVRAAATPPPTSASIQVPSVVGDTRGDAEAALRRAGLTATVATVPGAPPAGQVLAQDPPAGQALKSGDAVRINVSDGATPTASTTSTPQATTPAAPATTSATPTTTTPSTTTSTPTTTSPSPTQSSSSGSPSSTPQPTPVSVPTLSGDVKSAVQSLVTKGLAATINYVPSDEPMGTVVSQSPAGGATSKTGTHITMSVSSGPGDKEQATVPDASGQAIKEAVGTMNSAGLRLILVKKTVSDRSQAGKVVEQTPSPGAHAPKRAQVLVYMGAYKG